MPTKQDGRALKNASTSDRCNFRRNTALPAASTPCSWKTRLAMSKPTVVISIVDGSFSSLHSTARAWHIDAVRGRPPHQIFTTRLRGVRIGDARLVAFRQVPALLRPVFSRSGRAATSSLRRRLALFPHDHARDDAP